MFFDNPDINFLFTELIPICEYRNAIVNHATMRNMKSALDQYTHTMMLFKKEWNVLDMITVSCLFVSGKGRIDMMKNPKKGRRQKDFIFIGGITPAKCKTKFLLPKNVHFALPNDFELALLMCRKLEYDLLDILKLVIDYHGSLHQFRIKQLEYMEQCEIMETEDETSEKYINAKKRKKALESSDSYAKDGNGALTKKRKRN